VMHPQALGGEGREHPLQPWPHLGGAPGRQRCICRQGRSHPVGGPAAGSGRRVRGGRCGGQNGREARQAPCCRPGPPAAAANRKLPAGGPSDRSRPDPCRVGAGSVPAAVARLPGRFSGLLIAIPGLIRRRFQRWISAAAHLARPIPSRCQRHRSGQRRMGAWGRRAGSAGLPPSGRTAADGTIGAA